MATSKPKMATHSGEACGLRLLQSVREMKAGQGARVTRIGLREVVKIEPKALPSPDDDKQPAS